jgi:Zn-dependent peptidase ImmA (M78 family)
MSKFTVNYMLGSSSRHPYMYVDRDAERTASSWSSAPVSSPSAGKVGVTARRAAAAMSTRQIEVVATKELKLLWQQELVGKGGVRPDPIRIIDPVRALVSRGYSAIQVTTLGQSADAMGAFEVAGEIDPSIREVRISEQFSLEQRRFTAAHELGHALLHPGMYRHRDRPIDRKGAFAFRPVEEYEADVFAACFLMPTKLITEQFELRFLTREFKLSPDVAFALGFPDLRVFRSLHATQRDLSRLLAGIRLFNGQNFPSLHQLFGVSLEAMAIRLEELGLVSLDSAR